MLAALMMWPCAASAKVYKSIQVTKQDGSTLLIKGEQGISMTVNDEEMKFFTTPDNHISFPVEEVKGVTLSEEEGEVALAGIDEITAGAITVTRAGENLILGNLPVNSKISVVSTGGTILYSEVADGECVVCLSPYSPGVYVIVINNKTFKISVAR